MRLRNKKTGEIKDFLDVAKEFINGKNGKKTFTLAELNEEWEDYEEPKVFWYIDCNGAVRWDEDSDFAKDCKQIGNYFETKEEAEKAVEKLKAWKRLKDGGFRFTGYSHYDWDGNESPTIGFEYSDFDEMFYDKRVAADIDLLFGGEE